MLAAPRPLGRDVANIGKSVLIKGQLSGSEDLIIEGEVEGTIELKEHVLTVGPNGRIRAQVFAKAVIVQGEVVGNLTAAEKVDIRDNGSVDGDIVAPRVAIADGAVFRGSVDMQRAKPAAPKAQVVPGVKVDVKPAVPAPSVAASAGQTPSAGARAGA